MSSATSILDLPNELLLDILGPMHFYEFAQVNEFAHSQARQYIFEYRTIIFQKRDLAEMITYAIHSNDRRSLSEYMEANNDYDDAIFSSMSQSIEYVANNWNECLYIRLMKLTDKLLHYDYTRSIRLELVDFLLRMAHVECSFNAIFLIVKRLKYWKIVYKHTRDHIHWSRDRNVEELEKILKAMVIHNRKDIIEHIFHNFFVPQRMVLSVVKNAVRNVKIDIVKLVLSYYSKDLSCILSINDLTDSATLVVKNAIEWYYSNLTRNEVIAPKIEGLNSAIHWSAIHDHPDTLLLLFRHFEKIQKFRFQKIKNTIAMAFYYAFHNQSFKCLQWLTTTYKTDIQQRLKCARFDDAIYNVCEGGDIKILKQLFQMLKLLNMTNMSTMDDYKINAVISTCYSALCHDNWECLQWLCKTFSWNQHVLQRMHLILFPRRFWTRISIR